MNHWAEINLALILLILPIAGCSLGRAARCPVACTTNAGATLDPMSGIASKVPEVTANFENVPDYASVRRSLLDDYQAGQPITLNLEESLCLAAQYSPLARVIEDERRSIVCRLGPENRSRAIEVFLDAQAIEQRNKAAANGGELFLRLAEIQLQHQLLDESVGKLQELERTLSKAEDAGLATADAHSRLNSRVNELKGKRSDLEIAEQKVIIKLNALIGFNDVSVVLLQPRHELSPHDLQLNLQDEIAFALAQRPRLQALQDISTHSSDSSVDSVLSELGPALGLNVTPPLKKRILGRWFQDGVDPASGIRRQQIKQILAAQQQQVQVEVAESVLEIQKHLHQVALANEELERLASQMKLAESKSEIDAKESFFETIRLWADQQQVQSDRISAAIQLEVAELRLQEAEGRLASRCGFEFVIDDPCAGQ